MKLFQNLQIAGSLQNNKQDEQNNEVEAMRIELTNEILIKDIREEINPTPTPVQKQTRIRYA